MMNALTMVQTMQVFEAVSAELSIALSKVVMIIQNFKRPTENTMVGSIAVLEQLGKDVELEPSKVLAVILSFTQHVQQMQTEATIEQELANITQSPRSH